MALKSALKETTGRITIIRLLPSVPLSVIHTTSHKA